VGWGLERPSTSKYDGQTPNEVRCRTREVVVGSAPEVCKHPGDRGAPEMTMNLDTPEDLALAGRLLRRVGAAAYIRDRFAIPCSRQTLAK
jgi:hypothetical protein